MFTVFSIQRVKEFIEGAGKQREVWEVFVPQALGSDETRDTSRIVNNTFAIVKKTSLKK